MQVKLLKDIEEDGHLKVTRRRNKAWTPPCEKDGKIVHSPEPEFKNIPFVAGAIIDCSDATGQKWIAAGLAEAYTPPSPDVDLDPDDIAGSHAG